MNLFYTLFLFLLSFSTTPSFAQDPDSTPPVTTTSPSSGSDVSSSPSTSSTTSTTATFANLTTTNSQGSTIVTSVPITIVPSTTASTTSSAPFPSLTSYSTCVTNCLTDAVAQVNCSSITAVACFCANQTFPAALYACVASNCSASVPSAENLAQRFCAIDNVTLSFASTAAPTSSSPSSSSASSSSSTPSNAATATFTMPDGHGWSGMALAACGALFGAALL